MSAEDMEVSSENIGFWLLSLRHYAEVRDRSLCFADARSNLPLCSPLTQERLTSNCGVVPAVQRCHGRPEIEFQSGEMFLDDATDCPDTYEGNGRRSPSDG